MSHHLFRILFLIFTLTGTFQLTASELRNLRYFWSSDSVDVASLPAREFFKPWSHFEGGPIIKNNVLWLSFDIGANSPSEYIYTDAYHGFNVHYTQRLFDQSGNMISVSGAHIPRAALPISSFRYALKLPDHADSASYYVQLEFFYRGHIKPFQITAGDYLLSQVLRVSEAEKHKLDALTYGIFYGALALCLILALIQYISYREPAYAFYILYLIGILMLYLRTSSGQITGKLSMSSEWGPTIYAIETPIEYLIFGSYTLFLYYFINIQNLKRPIVQQLFVSVGLIFLLMVLVDPAIKIIGGETTSRRIFNGLRLILMPLSIIGVIWLIGHAPRKLLWYIIIGTLFVLVPSIFTAFEQMAVGHIGHKENHGLIRSFTLYSSDLTLWMYNTRIGIVLEIFCFAVGLLYRNQFLADTIEEKKDYDEWPDTDPILKEINYHFEANLTNENYDIESMCRDLGMSKTTLHQKIKEVTSYTPILYLRHLRMKKARILLRERDLQISEVAYAVGYKDPNYFSRIFTKEFGISPKRMRGHSKPTNQHRH